LREERGEACGSRGQGEVLEGELTMAAEEEGEDPKQVEQEGNHRAGNVAGSRPADQRLTRRMGFWRRTGNKDSADVVSASCVGSSLKEKCEQN